MPFFQVCTLTHTHTHTHTNTDTSELGECTGLIGKKITGLSELVMLQQRLTGKECTWLGMGEWRYVCMWGSEESFYTCLLRLPDLTDCWITTGWGLEWKGEKQLLSLSAAADFTSSWMPQWGKNFELSEDRLGGEHERQQERAST